MGTIDTTRISDAARRFGEELRRGVPLADALRATYDDCDHPDIAALAVKMLARDGTIDMKRLACEAGMSRASLYRHYPDRNRLEGEIAARGAAGMAAAAAGRPDHGGRMRAIAEYLIEHPGEAAAMVPLAAAAPVDVVRTTTEFITGDSRDAAWILGLATMAATPSRTDDDVAAIRAYVEELVAGVG